METKKKVVGVYLDHTGNVYSFFTDLDLVEGDTVVCDTRKGALVGMVANRVDNVDAANKWIIQKVDLAGHELRLERIHKRELTESEMEDRAAELKKIEKFKTMADTDTVMAELLKQYEELDI